eukprot:TRINITY_DN3791_c0_g1_i1.p3 TRINITY_DN3791_c0_g1~~TRINITY_DN3791_c0_g1_i1.p3  ORF type:complete len:103 (+),score=14.09 TRINITY_DN3791_c0_g1_i1:688-996(+)
MTWPCLEQIDQPQNLLPNLGVGPQKNPYSELGRSTVVNMAARCALFCCKEKEFHLFFKCPFSSSRVCLCVSSRGRGRGTSFPMGLACLFLWPSFVLCLPPRP